MNTREQRKRFEDVLYHGDIEGAMVLALAGKIPLRQSDMTAMALGAPTKEQAVFRASFYQIDVAYVEKKWQEPESEAA